MKTGVLALTFLLINGLGHAEDSKPSNGAEPFIRQVVQSLIDDEHKVAFDVAEKVICIDNGEVLSREDLKKAWPELGKSAFKKKVTGDTFWRGVKLQIGSPLENKRLMSNKRVTRVYKYQAGDLHCDASRVQDGVENFIAYDKAFIYIIRKIEGKWTLIGIGG